MITMSRRHSRKKKQQMLELLENGIDQPGFELRYINDFIGKCSLLYTTGYYVFNRINSLIGRILTTSITNTKILPKIAHYLQKPKQTKQCPK